MQTELFQSTVAPPDEVRSSFKSYRDALKHKLSFNSVNLLGISIPVVFCFVFIALWWNRYLAITNDGWHYLYGWRILHGNVPYRDFFMFVPPFHALKLAAVITFFGNHLLAPQIIGFAERLIEAAALFWWLIRYFPAFAASLSTLFTMCLFLCDANETLSSMHEEAIFFPVLACIAGTFALEMSGSTDMWTIAAGLCSGIALLAKQTSGMAATGAGLVLLPAVIAKLYGGRRGLRALALFLVGWLVPVGLVVIWLANKGAVTPFLLDTLVEGPSSKGTMTQILARQFAMIPASIYLSVSLAAAILLLIIGAVLLWRKRDLQSWGKSMSNSRWLILLACLAAASLFCAAFLSYREQTIVPFRRFDYPLYILSTCVFIGEFGSLAMFLYHFPAFLNAKISVRQASFFFISGFSFALAFLLSFSWPTFTSMLIPGFAFVFAFALTSIFQRVFLRIAVMLACAGAMSLACWEKLSLPFNWAGWAQGNIWRSTATLPYPELAGLQMSPVTASFVQRVTTDILTHSSSQDAVFVFPHIPIFYLLAHRMSHTVSSLHFIDITPDAIAEADAARLRADPPAVIVYFDQSEHELREAESVFRGGKRSGQRSILASIHEMSADYVALDALHAPLTGEKVIVLARKR